MFQACRPAGRLFYWVLVLATVGAVRVPVSAREEASAEKTAATNLSAAKPTAPEPHARAASPDPQSGPTLTSVVEVREHDYGWGPANGRNLLGRFSTQAFSLPRLARTQNYFLRLYDASSPPKYSRYSAALHIDIPF